MPRRTTTLVDEVFGWNGDLCRLVQIHRVFTAGASALTLRISVQAGGFGEESHAYAEVFSEIRTWTEVADSPLSMWRDAVPHAAQRLAADAHRRRGKVTAPAPAAPDYQGILGGVANRLLDRALTILETTQPRLAGH
jgi:hypothetical protein